jgi:uncharacterized protein (TIGR00369 family)
MSSPNQSLPWYEGVIATLADGVAPGMEAACDVAYEGTAEPCAALQPVRSARLRATMRSRAKFALDSMRRAYAPSSAVRLRRPDYLAVAANYHRCVEFEERIRASFAKQGLMATLGATLGKISPGAVEIEIRPHPAISQQHGFIHAGAVSAIADSAAGYAALSLMPDGRGVLTTEYKINLLAPAVGDRIVARGRVVKAGRTLTLAQAEVFAETDGQEKLIALLTSTLMSVEGREGITD